MNMQTQWKRWTIGGVAALTLTAGTFWAVENAAAASATTGWTDTVSQQVMNFVGQGGRGGRGNHDMGGRGMGGPGGMAGMAGKGGLFQGSQPQYLADALGIPLAELEAAQETVRNGLIDQAVADGTLTQEQADQLKAGERIRGFGLHLKGDMAAAAGVDHAALLADALGITVEELDAAQATARDAALAAALADGTLTQEQVDRMTAQQALHDYLHDAYPDARPDATMAELIAEAVAADVLTQDQADLLLSSAGRMEFGGRDGMRGHRDGGMRGDGLRAPRAQDDSQPEMPDSSESTPDASTEDEGTEDEGIQGGSTDSNA
jgi:hypothetical protein